MRITITEALVKLKTLDSRIDKGIRDLKLVETRRNCDEKVTGGIYSVEEFESRAKADYQSVVDLINIRSNIKSAIAISNANTIIEVGGKTYSVTQAIEKKNSIHINEALLSKLNSEISKGLRAVEVLNISAEQKANKNVEIMLGSDKLKNKTEESNTLYNQVYDREKGVLIDAVGAVELSKKKEEEIVNFLDEIDTKLVISNSTTFIEF